MKADINYPYVLVCMCVCVLVIHDLSDCDNILSASSRDSFHFQSSPSSPTTRITGVKNAFYFTETLFHIVGDGSLSFPNTHMKNQYELPS